MAKDAKSGWDPSETLRKLEQFRAQEAVGRVEAAKAKDGWSPVLVTRRVHAELSLLAFEESRRTGRRVTIRQLVEKAICDTYPEVGVFAAQELQTANAEQQTGILAQLVLAAFIEYPPDHPAWPPGGRARGLRIYDNAPVEALQGSVQNPQPPGQLIRLKDLAYELRTIEQSGRELPATLAALVASFVRGS